GLAFAALAAGLGGVAGVPAAAIVAAYLGPALALAHPYLLAAIVRAHLGPAVTGPQTGPARGLSRLVVPLVGAGPARLGTVVVAAFFAALVTTLLAALLLPVPGLYAELAAARLPTRVATYLGEPFAQPLLGPGLLGRVRVRVRMR